MTKAEHRADTAWGWIGASAIGTSHLATGEECQDRSFVMASRAGGRDTLIAVVCDGAGTAREAGTGAGLAAVAFGNGVAELLGRGGAAADGELIERVARGAAAEIRAVAERDGRPCGDYATTLVACVADATHATVVHVGDGACALRLAGTSGEPGPWVVPSWPHQGEYAGTTRFLTDATLEVERVTVEGGVLEVAILTDGMERLALDFATRSAHAPFLDPMMRPVPTGGGVDLALCVELGRFLSGGRVNARTDDDKTMVLARRRPAAPEG